MCAMVQNKSEHQKAPNFLEAVKWKFAGHQYYYSAAGASLPTASASALKIRVAGSAQGRLFVLSVMVGLSSGQSPEEISLLASTTSTASSS